ncbi:hypothetical protein RXV86_20765 [Alisedimentitalea sp. MJ-SS2]|uniref:hypothetical protein n=1 Tax=Aliisedimentitalea sp. MJ-SS2 TaxID=3049795 RepID=UPI002913995B|nr:hypothetical protein [Alisedimentitalea sp. MJ-SS2]MDU8929826.1 hypothetical protein [Alisedimentitalea sp. MJ-SS2]
MGNQLLRAAVFGIFAVGVAGCTSSKQTPTRNAFVSTSGVAVGVTPVRTAPNRAVPMQIYLTGYSYWDNTPRGSARIARPVIHRQAGGTGTYNDPITVAVGHSKRGGRSRMDFPAGTRFYFPRIQKYGIVEDLCGDGPRPQNGPCHSGYSGLPWLDIYVGGRSVSARQADRCMASITGVQAAVINPARGMPVQAGEISLSTCRAI